MIEALIHEPFRLMRQESKSLDEMDFASGSIVRVNGNQYCLNLHIRSKEGQTYFTVPTKSVAYLLNMLGIKSTSELTKTPIEINHYGGMMYGIGKFR